MDIFLEPFHQEKEGEDLYQNLMAGVVKNPQLLFISLAYKIVLTLNSTAKVQWHGLLQGFEHPER